jgi:hypothetical protein
MKLKPEYDNEEFTTVMMYAFGNFTANHSLKVPEDDFTYVNILSIASWKMFNEGHYRR